MGFGKFFYMYTGHHGAMNAKAPAGACRMGGAQRVAHAKRGMGGLRAESDPNKNSRGRGHL